MIRDTGNSVANGDIPDDEDDIRDAEAAREFYVETRVDDEPEICSLIDGTIENLRGNIDKLKEIFREL